MGADWHPLIEVRVTNTHTLRPGDPTFRNILQIQLICAKGHAHATLFITEKLMEGIKQELGSWVMCGSCLHEAPGRSSKC